MSAVELAAAIRARRLSPVEIAEAVLTRIDKVNPKLNAYCTVATERALADARAAETAVLRGETLGALHGLPISFKDLTPTAGIRTTMGSRIFEHWVPDADAIVVERARRAGAVVLGKTNTPEFGCKGVTDNRVFGHTRNPWNLDRIAGGSSGGQRRRSRPASGRWPRAATWPARSGSRPASAASSASSRASAGCRCGRR
jgi:amidase